jgi:hypothetical protein
MRTKQTGVGTGNYTRPQAALLHVNLRLTPEVVAFYKKFPAATVKMRQVLTEYAERHSVGSPTFPLTMTKEER